MRHEHPIDELFHRGLINAEIAPPAHVWDRVVAGRSYGHRTILGLKRRWWLPLLLLAFGGAGFSYWAIEGGSGGIEGAGPISANVEQAINATPASENVGDNSSTGTTNYSDQLDRSSITSATADHGDGDQGSSAGSVSDQARSGPSSAMNSSVASGSNNGATGQGARTTSDGGPTTLRNDRAGVNIGTPAVSQLGTDLNFSTTTTGEGGIGNPNEDAFVAKGRTYGGARPDLSADAFRLVPKRLLLRPEPSPRRVQLGTAQPAPKGLPPGEWWIGFEAGYARANLNWVADRAQQRTTAEALNKSESMDHSMAVSFLAGRQWRSGVSVSMGLGLENISGRFKYADRISTSFWTVDTTTYQDTSGTTTVLYDSTLVSSSQLTRVDRKNVYSLLRIPMDVSWHLTWKRWSMGPRVGLVAEMMMTRTGGTLMNVDQGEDINTMNNDEIRFDDRYPVRMSGLIALDIGYMLNESVVLWLSPYYTSELFSISGSSSLHQEVQRLGGQFRLQYVIPSR